MEIGQTEDAHCKPSLLGRIKRRLSVSSDTRARARARLDRLLHACRIFLTHLFSTTGLCFLVVIYSCLGALLFAFLESNNERLVRTGMEHERVRVAYELWNYTLSLNVFEPEAWKRATIRQLRRFEETIIKAVQNDGYSPSNVDQWSFSGALLYSVTVITTIGKWRTVWWRPVVRGSLEWSVMSAHGAISSGH